MEVIFRNATFWPKRHEMTDAQICKNTVLAMKRTAQKFHSCQEATSKVAKKNRHSGMNVGHYQNRNGKRTQVCGGCGFPYICLENLICVSFLNRKMEIWTPEFISASPWSNKLSKARRIQKDEVLAGWKLDYCLLVVVFGQEVELFGVVDLFFRGGVRWGTDGEGKFTTLTLHTLQDQKRDSSGSEFVLAKQKKKFHFT